MLAPVVLTVTLIWVVRDDRELSWAAPTLARLREATADRSGTAGKPSLYLRVHVTDKLRVPDNATTPLMMSASDGSSVSSGVVLCSGRPDVMGIVSSILAVDGGVALPPGASTWWRGVSLHRHRCIDTWSVQLNVFSSLVGVVCFRLLTASSSNPIIAHRVSTSSLVHVQPSIRTTSESPTGGAPAAVIPESQPFDNSDVVLVACGPEPLIDNARLISCRHGFAFHSELFNF